MTNSTLISKVQNMYRNSYSPADIAKALGISLDMVKSILKFPL